jgi:hypothetical protein
MTRGSSISASSSRPPHRGHARTSNPKLRCMSSAHSRFFRGRCAEDASLAPGTSSGDSRSGAARRGRQADRAPNTP